MSVGKENKHMIKKFEEIFTSKNLVSSEISDWIKRFVEYLYKKSFTCPTYLNDFRVPLFLRPKLECEENLRGKEQIIHFHHLIRLWFHLLSHESESNLSLISTNSPEDYIEQNFWERNLIDATKIQNKKILESVHKLIDEAKQGTKGLFTCPHCHSDENVTTKTEQRSRSDEGMTIVNICNTCKTIWHFR